MIRISQTQLPPDYIELEKRVDALKQVHQKMLQVTYVPFNFNICSISLSNNIVLPVPSIPTKHTTTLPTSKRVSVIWDAQSARKYTSSHPLPHLPKHKQHLLLLHPQSRNQRPSTMLSPVPVWQAASCSNNNTLVLEKTLLLPPLRSTPWPVSVSVKPDLPKTPKFRADSSQAGAQLSTPTLCSQPGPEKESRTQD